MAEPKPTLIPTLVILHANLDPSYLSETRSMPKDELESRADREFLRLRHTRGLDVHIFRLDPGVTSSIDKFKIAAENGPLKECGKNEWDGFGFGWELRSEEKLSGLFEELVNWALQFRPGAEIMFPGREDEGLVECCRRRFPEWAKGVEAAGEREVDGKD